MKHLFCDIETLGIVDQSVILSAGFVAADLSKDFTLEDLQRDSIHVKFDAFDQRDRLGRHIDQDTVAWWKKQDKEVIRSEVTPDPSRDMKLEDGLQKIREWIDSQNYNKKNGWVWTRGALDGKVLEHATKSVGQESLFPFYAIRDVRTAVDLLAGTERGYCDIEGVDASSLSKHTPVDDCILDALMIRYPVVQD